MEHTEIGHENVTSQEKNNDMNNMRFFCKFPACYNIQLFLVIFFGQVAQDSGKALIKMLV